MIVDDNEQNVDLLQQQLTEAGYDTVSCFSGLEALDKARESNPDVILLDLMMPHLDGYNTCSLLKKAFSEKFLPVIFLTVQTETQSKIKAMLKGADDYLIKPYDFHELHMRIQATVRLIELDQEKRVLLEFHEKTQIIFKELESLLTSLNYALEKLEEEAPKAAFKDLQFAKEGISKILKKISF